MSSARERSGSRGNAGDDPVFRRYWRDANAIPLLSAKEQHDQAAAFVRTRDPRLAQRLVAANLRLVVKLAHEYHPTRDQFADVVQEGNLGLMRAVERYDPTRGTKLTSYAAWWIRAYMMRFLMEQTRVVTVGRSRAGRRDFMKGHAAPPELSLDQPAIADEPTGDAIVDCLVDGNSTPIDTAVERREMLSKFSAILSGFRSGLDRRQNVILKKRWLDETPSSLAKVGAGLSVSSERARQLEQNILHRLRGVVAEELAA